MEKIIIFDIGANNGNFCCKMAKKNRKYEIHGFEPIPELYNKLENIKAHEGLNNLFLYNVALGATKTEKLFNISTTTDQGVSSFLDFNDNVDSNSYWKMRKDLTYQKSVVVKIEEGKSIMLERNIEFIDFIKIDTQGFDLEVLSGFGDMLSRIKFGCIEAPTSDKTKLYKGEPNLYESIKFLTKSGFKIYKIKPNDFATNEVNIFFYNEAYDIEFIEKKLGLDLYPDIARDYWYLPSGKYLNEWQIVGKAVKNLIRSLVK